MIKKTALALCALVVASTASAQMLLNFNLAVDQESYSESVIIGNNESSQCQLSDLLFEVVAEQEVNQAKIGLKIFRVTDQGNILVTEPQFTVYMNQPAGITLEKDGQTLELTIVAQEIV